MARLEHFKTTPESRKTIDDLYLASQVRTRIVDEFPACTVSADGGRVVVGMVSELTEQPRLTDEVKRLTEGLAGVEEIVVSVTPYGV